MGRELKAELSVQVGSDLKTEWDEKLASVKLASAIVLSGADPGGAGRAGGSLEEDRYSRQLEDVLHMSENAAHEAAMLRMSCEGRLAALEEHVLRRSGGSKPSSPWLLGGNASPLRDDRSSSTGWWLGAKRS